MLETALTVAMVMVSISLILNLFRIVRGPSLPDRILALDTLYINSIALLLVYGIYQMSTINFEAALLIAMLGFVSTAALTKYLLRGDIIE
ncbi:K+/H+ antiporter subunit F [Marinobacterium sp. LSUCC0821]|jgi:multicomponent K+:H+ antiporter subunit F|uniref:K+/H+ antiporter subunit F n=1 Tax=Marinobacterium sp. LSUCC0821 TaxID=2668067 RepID=UPI0014520901|nr:K+/H+ antiporter subunit F [Marinobacterium sp. LSUCC0821]QJD71456.1 K+/H+ antiporter subunit F [Marinobacterium sp. LSUCC0821]